MDTIRKYMDEIRDLMERERRIPDSSRSDALAYALIQIEKARSAPVIRGTYGAVFCPRCKGILPCDDYGSLPRYCSDCGQRLTRKR